MNHCPEYSEAMFRLPSNPYLAREWPAYIVGPDMRKRKTARACVSGVYFLFAEGELLYIGQSIYVGSRVASHRNKLSFDRFGWVEVPADLLVGVEAAYLHALTPPMNKYIPEPVFMQHDKIVAAVCERWARDVPHLKPAPRRPGLMVAERAAS